MSQLEKLFQPFEGLWVGRYGFGLVASVAVQIYDYFTTLDREFQYVWPNTWNLSKMLYILNRYLPFFASTVLVSSSLLIENNKNLCIRTASTQTVLVSSQFTVSEYTLLFRTFAILHGNRLITATLLFFAITGTTICYFLSAEYIRSYTHIPLRLLSPGCIITSHQSTIYLLSVLIIFELFQMIVLVGNTLWTAHLRNKSGMHSTGPFILQEMAKQGIMYFAFMIMIWIVNISGNFSGGSVFSIAFIPLQATLQNILSARLLLHTRSRNADQDRQIVQEPPA